MSKELTPLEWLHYYEKIVRESNQTFRPNGLEIIEKTLKKYSQLLIDYNEMDRINDELNLSNHQLRDKNIKLNKALEKLKECYENELKNVSYYNNLALKYKKALEIIKEKILDMDYFNIIADRCDLTYQEYELLKEILK